MYAESCDALRSTLNALEERDVNSASEEVSLMEAYLPIDDGSDSVTSINRTASRYTTLVSQLSSDEYVFHPSQETMTEELLELGHTLEESMHEENADQAVVVYQKLCTIRDENVQFTGDAERLPEDSAWGKIVQSLLDE